MGIGDQLLFFMAGLGVFNGILLAFYFLFGIKPKRWVNILFGLLMLMLCIRIGKSLFHIFTDVDRIYRQIGLSACMMIGPLLYLYIQQLVSKAKTLKQRDWPHLFIPFITILLIGIIWPYESNPDIWNFNVVRLIYAVWAIYMILASRAVLPFIQKTLQKQASTNEIWIVLVFSCVLLLCIAYILAYYGFPYLSGPILFSIVLYVLMIFLISKKNRSVILYDEAVKYQNQSLSEEKTDVLLKRLDTQMRTEHFYLNNKLKLADIASSIDATPHEVSQVINQRLGLSFNAYINAFRIQAACKMLEEADHLTIEGIGQEVGFNSRSAFYVAFKNLMKQTPAQYKAQMKHAMK